MSNRISKITREFSNFVLPNKMLLKLNSILNCIILKCMNLSNFLGICSSCILISVIFVVSCCSLFSSSSIVSIIITGLFYHFLSLFPLCSSILYNLYNVYTMNLYIIPLGSFSSIYILIIGMISISVVLICISGSSRSIIGILLLIMSISLYLLVLGYILLPILLIIGILVICIILYLMSYNSYHIYSNNLSIILYMLFVSYLMISFSISSSSNCYNNVLNMELLSFVVLYESCISVYLLILLVYIMLILICMLSNSSVLYYSFSNTSYSNPSVGNNVMFSVLSYVIVNLILYVILAIVLCYIPIVIRYSSKMF